MVEVRDTQKPRAASGRSDGTLLDLARDLLASLAELYPLPPPGRADPRKDALLLLEAKVVPELEAALDLPVFVGVAGGTNTGKSTVFNALAGKILSPALVTASATKHPLVFLHERWRDRFLGRAPFRRLVCRELIDPKELITLGEAANVLYFRFHEDATLQEVALIDSPDFDGALESNADQASVIAAISDRVLFVTTAQKYKDRILIEELRRILDLKGEALIVFNHVGEEIVFQTLIDDLVGTLSMAGAGPHAEGIEGLRLPTSEAKHPEADLREILARPVLERFARLRARETKPPIVARAIARTAGLARKVVHLYSVEAGTKRELEGIIDECLQEARREYRESFRLAFPEETLAIRRVLALTEVGPRLELREEVRGSRHVLALAAALVRRANDGLRKVVVRLSPSREGLIDATPGAIEEYSLARNRADAESVSRLAERTRLAAESFLRGKEGGSAFARAVLRTAFTPELNLGLRRRMRESHDAALQSAKGAGGEIVVEVETWIAMNPGKSRLIGLLAILFKLAAGTLLAWGLPPSFGLLGILHPIKWLYFAAGYIAAAYIIALIVCFKLRRKKRFQEAREEAMERALRTALLDPLSAAMDAVILEERIERIQKLAGDLEASPELERMAGDGVKGRGRTRP